MSSRRRAWVYPPPQALFTLEHKVAPSALRSIALLANTGVEGLHPALFVGGRVGVEIDHLAVVEADTESLLDKHVTLFFLCKPRLAALATAACGFLLGQGSAVIDELTRVGQVDGCTRLSSRLVICCQLGPLELEEAAAPVLDRN